MRRKPLIVVLFAAALKMSELPWFAAQRVEILLVEAPLAVRPI
jgi:hypothetical protein